MFEGIVRPGATFAAAVVGMVCTACVNLHAQPADSTSRPAGDDPAAIAQAFVNLVVHRKFDEATLLYDQAMREALPAEKLQETWDSMTIHVGAFKSFGPPKAVSSGEYRIVTIQAEFALSALNLQVTVSRDGRIAGFFTRLRGEPAPEYKSPRYDDVDKYTEKEVSFGEAPWTVKGKLTMPKGKGPVPGVVLVHGSGPNDEDETIGPNRPFRDIAGGLSSRGIAVLRYQKRTFAYAQQLVSKPSITVREEVIDDVLAALRFLRAQEGIDPNQVYLLGHSLGGTAAPVIAAEDKKVAGIVLLAGTPRDFFDVILEQLEYIASLPGQGQQENKKGLGETRRTVEEIRSGADATERKVLGVSGAYWQDVTRTAKRGLSVLPELKCRILILGGGRDYQVTREDFDLYRGALKGCKNARFVWFKNVNHLFHKGRGKATPAEYGMARYVDKSVIKKLAGWITNADEAAKKSEAAKESKPGRKPEKGTKPPTGEKPEPGEKHELGKESEPGEKPKADKESAGHEQSRADKRPDAEDESGRVAKKDRASRASTN